MKDEVYEWRKCNTTNEIYKTNENGTKERKKEKKMTDECDRALKVFSEKEREYTKRSEHPIMFVFTINAAKLKHSSIKYHKFITTYSTPISALPELTSLANKNKKKTLFRITLSPSRFHCPAI